MSEQGPRVHDEQDGVDPDLGAVLADDRLVESVASGELTAADVSDDVVALLVAWRDHVDAAPVPLHPDLGEARAALLAATTAGRWRVPLRVLSPIAAAAAAVGIALVGVGYAAHQSAPGDPLWGVSQAVFADHSRSVQAAANVTAELAEAETAITSGTPEKARTALDRAATDLAAVGSGEGRADLERRHSELVSRLDDAAVPAPLPTTAPSSGAPVVPTVPATTSAPAVTTTPTRSSTPPSTNPVLPPASSTTEPAPTTTDAPPTTDPAPTTDSSTPAPTTDTSAQVAGPPANLAPASAVPAAGATS